MNDDDVSCEESMNSNNVVNLHEGPSHITSVDLPHTEKYIDSTHTNMADNDQNSNLNSFFLR